MNSMWPIRQAAGICLGFLLNAGMNHGKLSDTGMLTVAQRRDASTLMSGGNNNEGEVCLSDVGRSDDCKRMTLTESSRLVTGTWTYPSTQWFPIHQLSRRQGRGPDCRLLDGQAKE